MTDRRLAVAAATVVLALCLPAVAAAQDVARADTGRTITVGDRIRVRTAPPHDLRLTGRVDALTPDTLALRTDGKVRRLGLGEIRTLELPTGKTERFTGALVGLITGGLLGASAGSAIERGSSSGSGLGGGFYGLMIGAPAGLAAGYAFLGHDEWVKVPVEWLRVRLGPGHLRLGIPLGR